MELVYDQVNHLTQRIRSKAENGKEDSLHLARKVSVQIWHSLLHTSQQNGLETHTLVILSIPVSTQLFLLIIP